MGTFGVELPQPPLKVVPVSLVTLVTVGNDPTIEETALDLVAAKSVPLPTV